MLAWIIDNKAWIFDGIGAILFVSLVGFFLNFFLRKPSDSSTSVSDRSVNTNTNANNISNIVNIGIPKEDKISNSTNEMDDSKRKRLTNILFVDDQSFKVVSILKNSGWKNTKIKPDLKSLDDRDLIEAHICFVDINGVGIKLGFKDEGLGLALAITQKYPGKKVIIYSAQSEGDRLHEALNKVDAVLRKNADPYEFQNLVEQFSKDLINEA